MRRLNVIALVIALTSCASPDDPPTLIGAPSPGPTLAAPPPDVLIRPSQIAMVSQISAPLSTTLTDATNASFAIRDYSLSGDRAHAVLTFPLGALPSAVVTSAQVTFRVEFETGGLYQSLGGLLIAKLTSRSTVQASAFSDNGATLGVFLNAAGLAEREVSFDLTAALEASHIAHDTHLTLKLRFASDTDEPAGNDDDVLTLYGHADSPLNPLYAKSPRLTVSFQ